jgi:hypothetical protein
MATVKVMTVSLLLAAGMKKSPPRIRNGGLHRTVPDE